MSWIMEETLFPIFPDQAKVTYQSKHGKDIKEFSCLEWMAAMIDRLTYKSYIVNMNGPSCRVKETMEFF